MARKGQRTGAWPALPRLPSTPVRHELPDGVLADHGRYDSLVLHDVDLSGQSARFAVFDEVDFQKVTLSSTRLLSAHLRDARFTACDLSQAVCDQAVLSRVAFAGCRLLGLKAVEAQLRDVLQDCDVRFALFWAAVCTGVRFERCALGEASFHDADLRGVTFARCDLRNADLRGAKLTGADLRGSTLAGVQLGGSVLEGAVIDADQAPDITAALRLSMQWSDSPERR